MTNARSRVVPTGIERFFEPDEIIVSKTDLKGLITYANREFVRISGFSESELLGAPHSCIRHPDMPRCVFKLLWNTIEQGREIFAYVKNMSRNGDHYWVHAHVTPTRDAFGVITGYHSNRRVPSRNAVRTVESLYQQLVKVESSHGNKRDGMEAATNVLMEILKTAGVEYDEFIFSLAD